MGANKNKSNDRFVPMGGREQLKRETEIRKRKAEKGRLAHSAHRAERRKELEFYNKTKNKK